MLSLLFNSSPSPAKRCWHPSVIWTGRFPLCQPRVAGLAYRWTQVTKPLWKKLSNLPLLLVTTRDKSAPWGIHIYAVADGITMTAVGWRSHQQTAFESTLVIRDTVFGPSDVTDELNVQQRSTGRILSDRVHNRKRNVTASNPTLYILRSCRTLIIH